MCEPNLRRELLKCVNHPRWVGVQQFQKCCSIKYKEILCCRVCCSELGSCRQNTLGTKNPIRCIASHWIVHSLHSVTFDVSMGQIVVLPDFSVNACLVRELSYQTGVVKTVRAKRVDEKISIGMKKEDALKFIPLWFDKSLNGLSLWLGKRLRSFVYLRAWITGRAARVFWIHVELPVIVPIQVYPALFLILTLFTDSLIASVHIFAFVNQNASVYILFTYPSVPILIDYRYVVYLMFL